MTFNSTVPTKICKCGEEVASGRVEALLKMGRSLSQINCIKCATKSDVPRKTGFMIRDHKMNGQIEIHDDPTVTESLYKASKRAGQGVSLGVKFHKPR